MYVLKSEGSLQEGFSTDLSFSVTDEIYCNVELKLHFGSTNSDPDLQNVCYHHVGHLKASKVFLISIIGSDYLQVKWGQ